MRKVIAILLILLGCVLLIRVFYMDSKFNKTTTFAPYNLLSTTWSDYKEKFINDDGRVIDYSQNAITTSEGQSYALLRAVYIDDREEFDKVWKWTKENLEKENKLFGWKWGEKKDGSYGFSEDGGENSAADADSDIALALIFAAKRWNNDSYLSEARGILQSIWETETAVVNGKRYLIGGNWANQEDKLIINPSYFSPFAWRIFAKVDSERDWESLISPAYDLLTEGSQNKLDKEKSVGLPPNWLSLSKSDGSVDAPGIDNLNTDYSFDAMRIPFRISLDYIWFNEKRAKDYLINNFGFLKEEYQKNGKLFIGYSHDGKVTNQIENPAMYATSLGYFLISDKELADRIYQEKIINLYSNDENTFKTDIPYYEQNWLWFGVSLYNDFLTNLLE